MPVTLTSVQVQEIRTLFRLGFTTESIAEVYQISGAQVANIGMGRAWKFLADAEVELPILNDPAILKLTTRRVQRSLKQDAQLNEFLLRQFTSIDDEAERSRRAKELLDKWMIKPVRKRKSQSAWHVNEAKHKDCQNT